MAIRLALGPALGPVFATRGFVPQPPAVDSPGGAAALTLPDVTAALTGGYVSGDQLAVGVVARIAAHTRAGFARIVGLAAIFAPEGKALPTTPEELMTAELPRGQVVVGLVPAADGTVPEHVESIEVVGLSEGRNDGQVVILYDDAGYPDTTPPAGVPAPLDPAPSDAPVEAEALAEATA